MQVVTPTTEPASARLSLVEKASILTEALPWLETYAGKTVVIKYGGNAMVAEEPQGGVRPGHRVPAATAAYKPVVVHGGGPQISAMLDRLGIVSSSGAAAGSRRRRRWRSSGWSWSVRSGGTW